MKLLQFKNGKTKQLLNINETIKLKFKNEILKNEYLKQILGGTGGGEDEDDSDEVMEWH